MYLCIKENKVQKDLCIHSAETNYVPAMGRALLQKQKFKRYHSPHALPLPAAQPPGSEGACVPAG